VGNERQESGRNISANLQRISIEGAAASQIAEMRTAFLNHALFIPQFQISMIAYLI